MKLRTARKIARLTQQELAKRAGVDDSLISRLERGQRNLLRYESAMRIAHALNVTAEELFGRPDCPDDAAEDIPKKRSHDRVSAR
jgi:transcriptional regulator with XRE-family HTH domain